MHAAIYQCSMKGFIGFNSSILSSEFVINGFPHNIFLQRKSKY